MKSHFNQTLFAAITIFLFLCGGCSSKETADSSDTTDTEQTSGDTEGLTGISTDVPDPVIELPEIEGWSRSPLEALHPADNGFQVHYDHESGMFVTLYQYTGGITDIPSDLTAPLLNEEMQIAKAELPTAVEVGMWEAAELLDERIAHLGGSKKRAICARYKVKKEGHDLESHIYILAAHNNFLKLRCTETPNRDKLAQTEALVQLLTAIGNSCLQGNFTGRWKLDLNKTQLGLADLDEQIESGMLWIDHRHPKFEFLREFTIEGQKSQFTYSLTIDGPSEQMQRDNRSLTMKLSKSGDDLVFHTDIEKDDGLATNHVTYSMQDDGKTLVAMEVYKSDSLNYENKWVFVRD